jgi:gamma-glutamylcyclotransferase (GGCT)/AIG2-like uncharacterized protein YtfP
VVRSSGETVIVIEYLFVYGTLAPGRPNEHVLGDVPGSWEPATVRGDLVDHGWGAAVGFPALVLRERGPEVHGSLFASDALVEHWVSLDEFEGSGYERVLTRARPGTGDDVQAWVYVGRLETDDSKTP